MSRCALWERSFCVRIPKIRFDRERCSANFHVPRREGRATISRSPAPAGRWHCTKSCKKIAANVIARPPSRWIATRLTICPEAVSTLKKFPPTKFDQTVTVSFRLGVDPKQSDQMVRGTCPLPHGSGKQVRVLVFAEGDGGESGEGSRRGICRLQGHDPKMPGRFSGFRCRDRDAGGNGGSAQARQGARSARPDAEPENRHRDRRHGESGRRSEGGPRRVQAR